jgi:predicted transposase/invertase (TIGR01784 family)
LDLSGLEIVKDSLIEKDLSDYYSDMLYKVALAGQPGFIYVLFEHKSYYERYVQLQLLEYMVKIWRLFIKQQKKGRKAALPIVIPLLICHGKRPWPENRDRLSSLLAGPTEELSAYIPDFGFERYDLTRYSDDEIKGTLMTRVVQLLFKYAFDPNLQTKLPDILSLMKRLTQQETGLQYFETILRYLFSIMEDITTETIKEIAEKALSKKEGESIMTLAEKLRREGEIRGKLEGKLEGLVDAIEMGMILKFPGQVSDVMAAVSGIKDPDVLKNIKEAIKTATDVSEISALIKKS